MNTRTNNLEKMIMTGSKGKPEQRTNIVSAGGLKIVNGQRARQNFGFKRTLAYFPRFDMTPEARGYITNSYLSGMTSAEYVYNAMASRFDLISKALSTSVTGAQNRNSIKNLESNICDNFRRTVKNHNIVEFIYGEDMLDPRRLEKVTFGTVAITDAEMETYRHADFPEFYAQMLRDRADYRDAFFKVENMNVKELLSTERLMPVDVKRLIDNMHLEPAKTQNLGEMVKRVVALCEDMPYVFINEIQERRRMKIPEHLRMCSWLMCMQVRAVLNPNALIARGIDMPALELICERIRMVYTRALIEPGTAVGIIAAQSFSEPLTQYMLDAHHRSALGGTKTSGMTKSKEILGARSVDKLSSPSMLIPVLAEYETDLAKVQEIANNIEVMRLRQFTTSTQIFVEKFGEPVHSSYAHERDIIDEFMQLNPLLKAPSDLVKWCIRLQLNKTTLILKNMSLDLIVTKLRELYPQLFIVYTPENAPAVILRIYMRNSLFKGLVKLQDVKDIKDNMLQTIIRGVNGVINTSVVKMLRNRVGADGSIGRVDNIWGIKTNGTNIGGIISNKYVDKYNVLTDAIMETYRMFGVEAARQRIISELRALVDSCNHRHYMVYANEMTYTGKVTSIESSGLKTRESNNVLLRIGFSSPMSTLEEASINCMEDAVTGVSAPVLMGRVPSVGSLYNSFSINKEFVKQHVKSVDRQIDDLFE
jgi:DNA-directed RNA polymerase beta' subunit